MNRGRFRQRYEIWVGAGLAVKRSALIKIGQQNLPLQVRSHHANALPKSRHTDRTMRLRLREPLYRFAAKELIGFDQQGGNLVGMGTAGETVA